MLFSINLKYACIELKEKKKLSHAQIPGQEPNKSGLAFPQMQGRNIS